jgi:hypothetical protein
VGEIPGSADVRALRSQPFYAGLHAQTHRRSQLSVAGSDVRRQFDGHLLPRSAEVNLTDKIMTGR